MSQGFTKAITLDTDGTLAADSDMLVASQKAVKTYVDNAVGGAGTVQSVTGLDTDNTDPDNPVVQIAVDGITITGQGTSADPLVGHSAGGLNLWSYKAKTTITTGNPTSGYLIWNNATQISATQININHLTDDGFDIDLFFPYLLVGDTLIVQDRDDSANFQTWTISGTTTITPNSYIQVPVTFVTSGGVGTTNFNNNHQLLVAKFGVSASGDVVGPASAIDSDIVEFDGTTGKLIKDGGYNASAIHLFNYQNLY